MSGTVGLASGFLFALVLYIQNVKEQDQNPKKRSKNKTRPQSEVIEELRLHKLKHPIRDRDD